MSSAWELPTALRVGGKEWDIRTDFRVIIDVLQYMADPEFEDVRAEVCLGILFLDFEDMPSSLWEEALLAAREFIDMGSVQSNDNRPKPRLMDWEQDAPIIIPAVNRVLGKEIRGVDYMHWWTFLGAYMEIGECLFSQVVSIRSKKAKGKKLEKNEQDFYKDNRELIQLRKKYSQEDLDEQAEILARL